MKLVFGTRTGLSHETQNLVDEFHFESELAFSVDNTMCRRWVEGSSRKGKKALHRTIFLSFCSTMDFLSLILVWSTACKTGGQCQQFDIVKIEGSNGRLSLLVLLARGNQKTPCK